jgi:hypothetical protein
MESFFRGEDKGFRYVYGYNRSTGDDIHFIADGAKVSYGNNSGSNLVGSSIATKRPGAGEGGVFMARRISTDELDSACLFLTSDILITDGSSFPVLISVLNY